MNKIICCDVLDGLNKIENNSIHLIITSPPYNVGINYDNYSDNLSYKDYLNWMKEVWKKCLDVLVDGGRICINIDETVNVEKELYKEHFHPLHVEFINQLRDIGYIYRATIVWYKQNIMGKNTAWGSYQLCSSPHIRRDNEYVIVACKNNMRLDGDNNQCDLTKKEFNDSTMSTWNITPSTQTNKKGHPVSFPDELVYRLIKLYSYIGNTVLDPFNGIGTTTKVAHYLKRNYIGLDLSEKYCKIARKALNKADLCEVENKYKDPVYRKNIPKELFYTGETI